jgi:itaconate CoA-transferase
MYADLHRVFARYSTAELSRDLSDARIPWAEVNDVPAVANLAALKSKLTTTRMPGGQEVRLQPLPVDTGKAPLELSFPPVYGEDTAEILEEIGINTTEIRELVAQGIVVAAAPPAPSS